MSALYTANNQLSFYVLEVADPGTMSLGKSVAPYLCALLLRFTGQYLHQLQWVCVIIQCCAIAIVQYDSCKGSGVLPLQAYLMIGAATFITAVTSVWNQLVIKDFDVPLNLQNSILYCFGSGIAVSAYVWEASTAKKHVPPFFHGYNALAALLVVFQAFHGLAVALVYKYADAIVKNFANSSVMALLIAISYYFFALQTNLHSWLGIVIVLTTTYCYMNIAVKLPRPGAVEVSKRGAATRTSSAADEEGAREDTKLLEMSTRSPAGAQ
jgi:UDP-sugar transporter A1/2/3